MAVINTDVGLHLECLPQISRQPPLKCKVDLKLLVLVVKAPSSCGDKNIIRLLHAGRLTGYIQHFTLHNYFMNCFVILPLGLKLTV